MATSLLQSVVKPENTSGNIGTYTIKAKEGYIITSAPDSMSINGTHWDLTGDNTPIIMTSGTDFRDTDGSGTGLHGTQTFSFQFEYDVPSLSPTDASVNDIYVNLNVAKIPFNCPQINQYITFSNGKPQFAQGAGTVSSLKYAPPVATANVFFGSQPLYLGLAQQNYSWFVDNESDAFTVYSANSGLSLSSTNSKTVNVSTSVFTGNITIYWGTVTVSCTGDFGKASMIFSDGLRGTKDFVRHEPSCLINIPEPVTFTGGSRSRRIVKTDDCDFIASNRDNDVVSDLLLESKTNGYSFSLSNFNKLTSASGNSSVGDAELIFQNNLYIAITAAKYALDYSTKTNTGYSSYVHRSVDRDTFTQSVFQYADGSAMPASVRDVLMIEDVTYAGYDSVNDNHVWYASATYDWNTSSANAANTPQIYRSTDNAVTFQHLLLSGNFTENLDFLKVRHTTNSRDALSKIKVNLEKDYGFILIDNHKTSDFTSRKFSTLFRFFPSQADSGVSLTAANANSNWIIKPMVCAQTNGINPTYDTPFDTEVYGQKIYDGNVFNNPYLQTSGDHGHINFEVFDTGICIFTFTDKYAISWNFGLDWTYGPLPTVNHTHSVSGTSHIYPEHHPSPFLFDNQMYAFTGQTSQYNQRNSTGNNRLIYSLMKINLNDSSSLITGNVPSNWSQGYTPTNQTITVTVANASPNTLKFYFDGVQNNNSNVLTLTRGTTVTFDQSDSSNAGYQLSFTSSSSFNGNTNITNNITVSGTPGQAGAQTQLIVPKHGFTQAHYFYSFTNNPYTVNISGHVINTEYPVQVTDIISSWEVVREHTLKTVTNQNDDHIILDILVDNDQPDNVKRIYAATGESVLVTPRPPAPTITDGASQPTITAPTLPSGTTLETATGDPFLTEVFSDDPFSIVFTRGDGTQMQFDGVFDIIVMSSTRPYIMDTVSNQTYTKYEGTFNATTGAANISGGTFQGGTVKTSDPSFGSYDVGDYNNFGFVYKHYAYGIIRQTSGTGINNLRVISNRSDLQLNANIGSGGVRIGQELTDGNITVPSGYSFNSRPHQAGFYLSNPNPLYLDHLTAFTKRINNNYFDVGKFEVGLKLYTDPQGTPYYGGYYWRRNWNYAMQDPSSSSSGTGDVTDFENAFPRFGELDIDPNFIFVNSDGFVTELGDNRALPDYDQCS